MKPDRFSLQFIETHPEDAALSLESLNHEDMCEYISSMSPRHASLIIRNLPPISGSSCLSRLPLNNVAPVLKLLPVNTAASLIRRIPADKKNEILKLSSIPKPVKRSIRFLPETAGAIMDTDTLLLPAGFNVKNTRDHLEKHKAKIHNRIFVINEDQSLAGFVELRDIMFAREDVALKQLVRRPNIKLSARDRLESISTDILAQQTEIYPVVDHANRLLGTISYNDLKKALLEFEDETVNQESITNDLLDLFNVVCDAFDTFLTEANEIKQD